MAATKCPECERVIRFHARGEKKLTLQCSSKRCGTVFTAELMGHLWPDEKKPRGKKR